MLLSAQDDDGAEPRVLVDEYERRPFKGPSSLAYGRETGALFFTDSGPFGESTLESPTGSVFCVSGPRGKLVLRPVALQCLAHPCGIALSPDESVVYVAEMMRNRIVRYVQRPEGVFHASVFKQFEGFLGPSAIAVHRETGHLFVCRFDFASADREAGGVVTQLDARGRTLRDIAIPAGELSGVTVTPDGKSIVVTSSEANEVFSARL